jgi:hypothetical protein
MFSPTINPRVIKNVKRRKSVRENRNSREVSQMLDICFTHSSKNAAIKNPDIPEKNISDSVFMGIYS